MVILNSELKEKYDTQYSDKTEEWRSIGAIGKVENILDLIKGFEFDTIVDVGAGDGNNLSLLEKNEVRSKLTAVEISDSAIEQIKKKHIAGLEEVIQFDGYTLPFKDKSFDLAICSHVLEHVEFPRMLLREIKRVSKMQVFEIPIDFSFNVDKKFNHFNSYGHINIYTPSLFNFLLLSEGFEIIRHKHALYRKEVLKFQHKRISLEYFVIRAKRFILKSIPALMKIKPNTYTVLTK
jgi:ubiquinone/menaquinone biosynthesis C-methylase UbiE